MWNDRISGRFRWKEKDSKLKGCIDLQEPIPLT
jgi:hypothetical protein